MMLSLTTSLFAQSNAKLGELDYVKIYPNPVSETINISSTTNSELKSIVLFNVFGQSVYKSSLSGTTNSINLSELASGIYIYKIENSQGFSTGKIQKK